MPKFSYIAKSPSGEEKTGLSDAKDAHELAKVLKNQGFILVNAKESEKKKKMNIQISIPFIGGVSLTDKMMFTRNLQVMIASGLPLPRALGTLALQTKNAKFKSALLDIKEEIVKGNNFADALSKYPSIFSDLFQNMIKVGEEAGNMEEVLEILSRQMERQHDLSSKIKGALTYPAVILFAMTGVGVLMLVMIVPRLAETFDELGVELPATTRFVIGLGTFFAEKWYLALVIFAIVFFIFYTALNNKVGKKYIDKAILKIPIVSSLVTKTNSAYTMRTLSSLLASGVPIVRALEITSGTLGNTYFKSAIANASGKVKKGEKLSSAMDPYKDLYPIIVIQMIKVGEETGESSKILSKLADFFEEEVARATKNMASIVEPVLMLVIGAVVGFFAISMVQPMYSMLGSL